MEMPILNDWSITNEYNKGWHQDVHLVLADPLGTESKKREINGRRSVAKAQQKADLRWFVEWGEENCPHIANVIGGRWACFYCLQELKKLAEGK